MISLYYQYCIIQYITVHFSSMRFSTVQNCTELYCKIKTGKTLHKTMTKQYCKYKYVPLFLQHSLPPLQWGRDLVAYCIRTCHYYGLSVLVHLYVFQHRVR